MQNPGILPATELWRFEPAEERIATKLASVWFITFSREDYFKRSHFSFLFAKPTDRLIRDFHLSREVLVLFSCYPKFDPRSLDFVDKTIFEFQNRLDKLCIILISRDPAIKTCIRDIAMQDRESRIIVPFVYDEFDTAEQSPETLIVDRLKEFFYERDLFALEGPLRSDVYFFGRSNIIQELYGKYKSGENGCLFGLRRIGKTSVLHAVGRYLRMRDEPAVLLDCSKPAFHARRWYEALQFIVSEMVAKLSLSGITSLKLSIPDAYDEKNAAVSFESDLRQIQSHQHGARLLIMLDEIENLTFDISPSSHWAHSLDYLYFWQSIRSVYQESGDLFSFIIAGVNPQAVETASVQGFDNPLYRLVTPTYLPFFNVEEVREMVSSIGNYMGLGFEDEIFTYLVDDLGGHPFLVRQVCSRIHRAITDTRPLTVTKFRYRNLHQDLSRSIQDYIKLIMEVLRVRYNDEYQLLRWLALGDVQTFEAYARESYAWIEHLIGYGLIQRDDGGYHFRIRAVESYVRETERAMRLPRSREERWQEITTARNTLETDLRTAVKRALKAQLGSARAREVFLDVISPPKRRDKVAVLSFEQMFGSEIYFEDLRKVIIANWELLGRIFQDDRDHFNTYMEFVNQHRVDAHAKVIEDDDYGILKIALKWLQDRVDAFLA